MVHVVLVRCAGPSEDHLAQLAGGVGAHLVLHHLRCLGGGDAGVPGVAARDRLEEVHALFVHRQLRVDRERDELVAGQHLVRCVLGVLGRGRGFCRPTRRFARGCLMRVRVNRHEGDVDERAAN